MSEKQKFQKLSSVGHHIRKERKRQKRSLEDLASASGVSKGMLSQLETDKVNPTVATIWKIAQALEVDLNQLVKGEAEEELKHFEVNRADDITLLDSDKEGTHIKVLSPISSAGDLELYRLTLEPKSTLNSEPHIQGAEEHLTVLSGHVRVNAGKRSAELKTGDVIIYDCDIQHSIENLSKKNADIYLVVHFKKNKD